MGALIKLIADLLRLVGVGSLPPWGGPAILLTLFAVAWPFLRMNASTDDARRILKHAARERGESRLRMEQEALEKVGDRPNGLVAIAHLALEQGRRELAEAAVAKLRATGKLVPELRKLERVLEPPLPVLASEACIVIERMLETGAVAHAAERVAQARKKWPFDEEVEALEARVQARVRGEA